MDFNALQHKLFAMDPVDPREDLARLKAQATGEAAIPTKETVDYLSESVAVPEGSLKMDRNYSVDDFAALAGVVNEKKQRPADQVRGNEPMPRTSNPSASGEQEHPLKDRLVGEADEDFGPFKSYDPDTIKALKLIKAHYPQAPDEMAALVKFIARISKHSKDEDSDHNKRLATIERRLDAIEQKLGNTEPAPDQDVEERKLSRGEKSKREREVKKLKKHKSDFTDRYGKDRGEQIMYAVATKRAKESTDHSVESIKEDLMAKLNKLMGE